MRAYTPQRGSAAYRAIKWLEEHPQEWVMGTVLAEALELPAATITPFLGNAPLKHGYLRKRIAHVGAKRQRRTEWALGPVKMGQPKPARSVPKGPGSVWDYAARAA